MTFDKKCESSNKWEFCKTGCAVIKETDDFMR